jgi:hypothetical protein
VRRPRSRSWIEHHSFSDRSDVGTYLCDSRLFYRHPREGDIFLVSALLEEELI